MANEVTTNFYLKVEKGNISTERVVQNQHDMDGEFFIHNVQTITNAGEAIYIGDVAEAGWCFFRNVGETSTGSEPEGAVEIGIEVGTLFYPLIRLEAGDCAQFPAGTNTFYAMAVGTDPVRLEVLVAEK